MGRLGLTLVTGPANAGKLRRLLDGYVEALPAEPVLIVPTRPDVELVERELVARCGALLGGSVGTFDDLFRRIASGDDDPRPAATDVQTSLVLARAVASTSLNGLSASARSRGFVDSLRDAIRDLESGLLEPAAVDGDLARLYAAYRDELERFVLTDRELVRARAAQRLAGDLEAWHGEPVFAYGFEDLTAAEWSLLEALAGRAELTVTLPYEPGRPAFASLRRTMDDLSALASGRIEEQPPRHAEVAHPALAHLERTLFDDAHPADPPQIEGAVRFFEGAGVRGALELVGEEVLELLRSGTAPEQIGLVCPSLERWRAPVETAFGTLGIPYAPRGAACRSEPRRTATRCSRSCATPGSAETGAVSSSRTFARPTRASRGTTSTSSRVASADARSRRASGSRRRSRSCAPVRSSRSSCSGARTARFSERCASLATTGMLRAAYGLEAPPGGEAARLDLRAHEACARLLDELAGWERLTGEPLAARTSSPRSSRRRARRVARRARPRRGRRPPARPHAPLRGRLSCWGWRRGACRAAAGSRRSSTTTSAAGSARGSSAPTRSAATATSSTPRARARPSASTSCARRRATRAARASRARSGRRSRLSSSPTTSPAGRAGARSRR